MDSNLLATDSISLILSEEELNQKIALIQEAGKGEITEAEHAMYDAGNATYSAFIYNAEKKLYQSVLLQQTGDFRIENKSPQAQELYEWLTGINQRLSSSN